MNLTESAVVLHTAGSGHRTPAGPRSARHAIAATPPPLQLVLAACFHSHRQAFLPCIDILHETVNVHIQSAGSAGVFNQGPQGSDGVSVEKPREILFKKV